MNQMSALTQPANQTDIFARSLDRHESIPRDVARFFLELELADNDRLRLNELAGKAQAGTLSAGEQAELDEYRRVGRLVELMKLKARFALRSV
jgi:hypothetical protein